MRSWWSRTTETTSGDMSAGRSSSTPASGCVFMTVQLLVGQPAGLVEHLGRDGELADVVHQQAEAELAHALVDAVVAAAAAVVDPAVGLPGAAGDQQPEHGHLDAVAVRVVVERAEVVEGQRGLGAVEEVVDHRRRRRPRATRRPCATCRSRCAARRSRRRAPRRWRGAPCARVSGVSGSSMSMSVAELVLDPDRADAGLRQQRRVARGQLDAGAQQRRVPGGP